MRLVIASFVAFVLGQAFLISLPILLGVSVWLLVGICALAALLGGIVAYALHRFAAFRLGLSWMSATAALVSVVSALVVSPIYYLVIRSALNPAALPQVVLTNGHKTLIFQGMMHIGSESFYRAVYYDLQRALADGSVIYYEGVMPDTEGDAWLNKVVSGGKDLGDSYKKLAGYCGLVFQNDVLGALAPDMRQHPERHVVADVSSLDLKREAERLMQTDPALASAIQARLGNTSEPDDLSQQVVDYFLDWQEKGTVGQKTLGGVICRGLIGGARDARDPSASEDPLDRVILDFRNRKLAERILAEPNNKIFMTYGAAHLPGVYQLLQRADANWKVVSVKWMQTVEPPPRANGTLNLTP